MRLTKVLVSSFILRFVLRRNHLGKEENPQSFFKQFFSLKGLPITPPDT
jgi:hypothetical protein